MIVLVKIVVHLFVLAAMLIWPVFKRLATRITASKAVSGGDPLLCISSSQSQFFLEHPESDLIQQPIEIDQQDNLKESYQSCEGDSCGSKPS